jgi:D-psicose/D-tagatose/L-ribulose 3-epimerase
MKIGFEMILWTTHVTNEHRPILEALKRTGYDGVQIPIFEGTPDHYVQLGRMLDDIGLERSALSIIGRLDQNPLSEDAAHRRAGVDYMSWLMECCQALGADNLGGPLYSSFGHFTEKPPSADERARAIDFHREVGDIAARRGVRVALEALNRFEGYFLNTMDDLAAHVTAVNHPAIQALYDTFHANIEERDPVAAFARNAHQVIHVHISENDRGVPGRGHVPWAETYRAIYESGYDGWLTIESFGRLHPGLAAASRIWRELFATPEEVYREGFLSVRDGWANARRRAISLASA